MSLGMYLRFSDQFGRLVLAVDVPQAFAKFTVAFTRKWTGVSTFTPDFNTCTTWGKKKKRKRRLSCCS